MQRRGRCRADARGRSAAAAIQRASTASNVSPGCRLSVRRTGAPSRRARAQCRDAFEDDRAADAEVRPEQGARRARRERAVDPDRDLAVDGDAREAGVDAVGGVAVEDERRQRGRRGTSVCPSDAREVVAPAVAAGLRQRSPAGGEDDGAARRSGRATCRARILRRFARPRATRVPARAGRRSSARPDSSAFSTLASLVRVRKQLAAGLFVQRHAELAEEARPSRRPGSARSTRRTMVRLPPQKSVSATTVLVTLQRPPPLTRIFAPGPGGAVQQGDVRDGPLAAAKIAVARPAAPAPTIATSGNRSDNSAVTAVRNRACDAHQGAYTARVSPFSGRSQCRTTPCSPVRASCGA